MKNRLSIGLLLGALLSTVFAGTATAESLFRIGADIDYSNVAMDQVNNQLNKGGAVTKAGPAISGMLSFDIATIPFIMLGARAGYLYCVPSGATYNYVVFNQKTTINASLIPLELGVSANADVPTTPLSGSAGAYFGYGFALASINNDISALGQTATLNQPYNGGGFVGELVAAIRCKLDPIFSVNINGGYRLAKISQMIQTQDVSYTGIPGVTIPVGAKGDVLKDSDNADFVFDFSGFTIGVGASIGF